MGAGSSSDSIRLGLRRELGLEETSRSIFREESRLVSYAQGFTLSGSLYKRHPGSGKYRKVDAVIEGTVLCCIDCKGGPSFMLRVNDVADLVVNRAQLKFTLFDKKVDRSTAHDFRASIKADFERWVSGLEQWLDLLAAARKAEAEERVAGRMQRIRRKQTLSGEAPLRCGALAWRWLGP